MTNAAAIATLCEQAPGRVAVAIGAGFSGRLALGQRPMRWRDVAAYVRVLRALLAGEDSEWEGAVVRMLQPRGFGAPRPIDVPILIGADGPKGLAVAAELGDGVFSGGLSRPAAGAPQWQAMLAFGTVFNDGEDVTSPRVLEAVAPAGAVLYHATYERGANAVDALPGGRAWREEVELVSATTRHLAIHGGHLAAVSPLERSYMADLAPVLIPLSVSRTPDDVRQRVTELATIGVTEIAYQPMGDIDRELRAFASATLGA
jgi:5,10-methylenetetrahydromethanopterin reductase